MTKVLGKYDKSNEYSKNNEYRKGNEKRKGQGQGQRREASAKFEFPMLLQVMCQVGHKTSECWPGYVQAVDEVPSSSASSSGAECSDHTCSLRRQQRPFKNSMMSRSQDGSSA